MVARNKLVSDNTCVYIGEWVAIQGKMEVHIY